MRALGGPKPVKVPGGDGGATQPVGIHAPTAPGGALGRSSHISYGPAELSRFLVSQGDSSPV